MAAEQPMGWIAHSLPNKLQRAEHCVVHNWGILRLSLTAKFHIFTFLKLIQAITAESVQERILKHFSKV